MRKEGRIKVQANASFPGKIHPFLKMLRFQPVPVSKLAGLKNCIAGMKIQLFAPGISENALSISAMSSSGVLAFPG